MSMLQTILSSSVMQFVPMPFVAAALASLGGLARHYLETPLPPAGPALSLALKGAAPFKAASLLPVALCTLGSVALYFAFLFSQATVGLIAHAQLSGTAKDGKKLPLAAVKYGAPNLIVRTMDRSVGNQIEQWIPFVLCLWLYALFVDAPGAARLGWLWIGVRSYYPFAFYYAFKLEALPIVFVSTLPAYLTTFFMAGSVALVAMRG